MPSKGSPLHGPQVRLVEQAHRLFAETKEHLFESKSAEEHAKLLRYEIIYQTTLRFEGHYRLIVWTKLHNLVVSIMQYPQMSPRLCSVPSLYHKIHQMNYFLILFSYSECSIN